MFPCLLTRREAADHLRALGFPTAPATLAKLACTGGGPTMTHFGRKPLYRPEDLLAWAESRCRVRTSTSDPGAPLSATAGGDGDGR